MLEQYQDILSPDDAAEILGVTRRAVYDYVKSGALGSFTMKRADGRTVRKVFIPKQALLDYMGGGK
jgi:excisionase family DNA binding protein